MEIKIIFAAVLCIIIFSVVFFLIGRNIGMGTVAIHTSNLPSCLMVVIYSDSKTTLLEELSPERTRYNLITEAFGGEPIKPRDVVRKICNDIERQKLKNPIHGYQPMIKDYIYQQDA